MMHNPMLSSCYMKKNVPWHVSTPCTLFCDRLRLRAVCASGHSEHIILSQPYMLRRELSSSLSRSYLSWIFLLRLSYRLRDHESFSCSSHRIYKIFREKDLFHEFKNKDHRPQNEGDHLHRAFYRLCHRPHHALSLYVPPGRKDNISGARQTRTAENALAGRSCLPYVSGTFYLSPSFWAARTPMWRSQWTVQGSAPYLSCL